MNSRFYCFDRKWMKIAIFSFMKDKQWNWMKNWLQAMPSPSHEYAPISQINNRWNKHYCCRSLSMIEIFLVLFLHTQQSNCYSAKQNGAKWNRNSKLRTSRKAIIQAIIPKEIENRINNLGAVEKKSLHFIEISRDYCGFAFDCTEQYPISRWRNDDFQIHHLYSKFETYLGSGRTIFLLALAAGVHFDFSIAIK